MLLHLRWNRALNSSEASHSFFNGYGDHHHHHGHHDEDIKSDDDVDDDYDGQVSLSYLPEHAGILLSVLTYAAIRIPDNLFRPTVTLLSLTLTYFYFILNATYSYL